jgi:ABC-2 type transport system permease protein
VSAFHPSRAWAVVWKDLLDLSKNKGLLASLCALPAVMVIVPTGIVYTYLRDPKDPSLRTVAMFYDRELPSSVSAAGFLVDKVLTDWFGLFLFMPIFVPILISSSAVAGERERRTLEPLLAAPITAVELVIGKSLAALIPAMIVTGLAFVALCCGVDWVSFRATGELLLPNGMWLFGVGVIAPLFAFFGNGVAVLVSARVGDTRLAQQIAGLVVLPLLGLVGAQVAGTLRAGTRYYALLGLIVLVLDVILVWASVRVFDRERLMTRWG